MVHRKLRSLATVVLLVGGASLLSPRPAFAEWLCRAHFVASGELHHITCCGWGDDDSFLGCGSRFY